MGTTQCDSVLRALHALAHLRTLDLPSDYVVRPDFDRTGVANRPSRGNLVCLIRASLDGQLHGVGVIFSHGGDEGPNRFFVRLPPILRLRHTVSFQLAGVSALGPSSMCQRHGPDPKKGRDAGWCRLRTDLGMR
jgi:hypothetical protein